ncbi:hypothetical protein Hamer_G020706 [Homarus americanus]|uniref:Uncharacterized protein n=1 Tax=Homarus americanus TaxID=6706 RepID=A0A8J5JRI9_HOMAM|nr:hypothetical protein Hamer_G020706 [Homarus americanus]
MSVDYRSNHLKVRSAKVGKSMAVSAPKAQTLPPTNEVLWENVARAHLQVAIWRNALELDPPILDPTTHSWSKEGGSNCMASTTVPKDTPLWTQQSY